MRLQHCAPDLYYRFLLLQQFLSVPTRVPPDEPEPSPDYRTHTDIWGVAILPKPR